MAMISQVKNSNVATVNAMNPVVENGQDKVNNGQNEEPVSSNGNNVYVPVKSTAIERNNEQFKKFLEESSEKAKEENAKDEEAKELLRSVSPEELEQLSKMQIDISSVSLSDVAGLIGAMRFAQNNTKQVEDLKEIIEDTKDKHSLKSRGKVDIKQSEDIKDDTSLAAITNSDNKVEISKEATKYLIQNKLSLTVGNIYKANHSGTKLDKGSSMNISNEEFASLRKQIEEVIESTGFKVGDDTLSAARYLLDNDLPVDSDNIISYMAIDDINTNGINIDAYNKNVQDILNEDFEGTASFSDANIYFNNENSKALEVIEKLNSIDVKTIDIAINRHYAITISSLYSIYEEANDTAANSNVLYNAIDDNDSNNNSLNNHNFYESEGSNDYENSSSKEDAYKQIKSKAMIEELRLMMTLDAAKQMVNKDFNIDTRPLNEVVNKLNNYVKEKYQQLFSSEQIDINMNTVSLYEDTLSKTQALGSMPADTLGAVIKDGSTFTINNVYEKGASLRSDAALQSYETIMTKPRADMGDSVSKAFRNVDFVLQEQGLKATDENRKAARILVNNSMEVNETNVDMVKDAGAKVNRLIENISPKAVLRMIRDEKNPLNMPIDELNNEIDSINDELFSNDEESYARFLRKLDSNKEISEEERKSFIGIYRLLDKVEKSNGNDVGYLVNSGAEITLNNLLAAHRSRKDKGIDVSLDDEGMAAVSRKGQSIDEQINSAFSIKTSYNKEVVRSIKENISPDSLSAMWDDGKMLDIPIEDMLDTMLGSDFGNEGDTYSYSYEMEYLKQAIYMADETSIKLLKDFELPVTADNIIAAATYNDIKDGTFKRIKDIKEQVEKTDISAENEYDIFGLEDSLDSKDSMEVRYNSLTDAFAKEMDRDVYEGVLNAKDIASMKLINAGMNIVKAAAKSMEYHIPYETENGMSIINLKIVNDGSQAGSITASTIAEDGSKIYAQLHVNEHQISGNIYKEAYNEDAISQNKGIDDVSMNKIKKLFTDAGYDAKDLSSNKSVSNDSKGDADTKTLFQVSKILVKAIKSC